MEKHRPDATVSAVDDEQEPGEVRTVSKWMPGYWKRFPFVGAFALAFMAAMACIALGVLIGSDGASTTLWPQRIGPSVILSLVNALSSLALTVAVGEGVAVAWWRHAMKGSTVAELHHQWQLSTGMFGLLFKPRSLFSSSIALAVLATQVTLLNSVLYMRATSQYSAPDHPKTLSAIGIGAQEFPMTGYVVSNTSFGAQTSCACFMIGDSFTPVVNTWETSNGFYQGYNELFRFTEPHLFSRSKDFQYCTGVCYSTIQAIGFEIDCSDQTNHTDIALAPIAAYNAKGDSSVWTDVAIFNSSFALEYATRSRNYSQITLNLQYFQSDDPYNPRSTTCPGTQVIQQCSLRPAIVEYPIKVTNFTSEHVINGVSLDLEKTEHDDPVINADIAPPKYDKSLKQAAGYKVVSYLYPQDSHTIRSLTALGGIANAFSQFLSSSAAITYQGGDWSLDQKGTLAQTMMYGPPNMGSCDCSFRSESLDIIIQSINQLTFLTATGMLNTSSFAGLPSTAAKSSQPFPSPLPSATIIAVDSNTTTAFRPIGSAVQQNDVTHYATHYVYAGVAFGITMLCIVLVIPSFWQYGELGRRVTLGPVEIASAFGAPILVDRERQEARNENIDTLIKHIGDRKIVYGFVDVDGDGIVDDHQEMHLQGSVRPGLASPGPASPQGDGLGVTGTPTGADSSPVASPTLSQAGSQGGRVQKRRSVRLAFSAPESVRPATQIYPLSPTMPHVKE